MPNTLDKFYNYTAEALVDFFANTRPLKAGERYFVHLEDAAAIPLCVEALLDYCKDSIGDFIYTAEKDAEPFHTRLIRFGTINLLIGTTLETTPHFLTTVRNLVAGQQEEFKGTALIMFITGQLDSLLEGCSDLTKSGMPLSFERFSDSYQERVETAFGGMADKQVILNDAYRTKVKEFRMAELNIFDFSNIIAIIQSRTFLEKDWQLLGLFPHAYLSTIPERDKIGAKVELNKKYFESIEFAVNYGNIDTDLKKILTTAGIDLIEKGMVDGSWKNIDFQVLSDYFVKDVGAKPVEFLHLDRSNNEEHIQSWGRTDDKNKRLNHIILFNNTGVYPFTQDLIFGSALKGELILPAVSSDKISVEKIGKNLRLTVKKPFYSEDFISLIYIDQKVKTARFHFRIWAINGDSDFLEKYYTRYAIDLKGRLELSEDNKFVEVYPAAETEYLAALESGKEYKVEEQQKLSLAISNEDEDALDFSLLYREQSLSCLAKQVITSLDTIKGWEVWQKKRTNQSSYRYGYVEATDVFKVVTPEQVEVNPVSEFKKLLKLELQMMGSLAHCWQQSDNDQLTPRMLGLDPELLEAYEAYYNFLLKNGGLPSLVYLKEDGRQLAKKYVELFISQITEIGEGNMLSDASKSELIMLGTVYESSSEQVLKFSPLHPVMVAYQLEIYQELGTDTLYEAMLKKLTPLNVVPYLYWANPGESGRQLYASKENIHSPEWQFYSSDLQFKQFSGREFIRDLVNEKISEFVLNFSFLFDFDKRAPIRINVYNMGDCLHVLQGIFDYYKDFILGGKSIFDLRPIELYLYGSQKFVTTFERLSHLIQKEDIVGSFELSSNSKRIDFEELINEFRKKVKYFALKEDSRTQYAHLTFYQFDKNGAEETDREHAKIPTGLSLNGLINDLPSYYHDHTFVTGFGTEFSNATGNLIRTSLAYNALGRVAFSKNLFRLGEVVCTTIDTAIKADLTELYDRSQWVVFVDPQFDLSFFKDDSDLIMVHYSDQYSNASGFDAITVSNKANQYANLLGNILKRQDVIYNEKDIRKIIDLFNGINGQWLIKMIGRKDDNARKEKMSIPAALKVSLAYFDHPEIIWVPVSLEEILRISGGAGLSQKEGLFSAKNLGAKNEHSDDLLLIGLYQVQGRLKMELYPVEVKIGNNQSDTFEKARNQASKTRDLLYERLTTEDKFEAKFYRLFFAKLAIINSGKMALYEIWNEKDWSSVFEGFRQQLMNDDFDISDTLSQYIKNYAVVAFTKDLTDVSYSVEDEGVIIRLYEKDAYHNLVRGVDQIRHLALNVPNPMTTDLFLVNQLSTWPPEDKEYIPVVVIEEKKKTIDEPEQISVITQKISREIAVPGFSPMQINIGSRIADDFQVNWWPTDTTKTMHTNTGIIGTMGTGKTQFTKSLVTQLSRASADNIGGKKIGILIFDYKGDYLDKEFSQATGAKIYQLHNLPYNPLAIDVSEHSMPLLPLHIASTLQETISNAFNLGNKQKALLKETIMAAYQEKGIFKNQPETWTRTAPTISDVCQLYLSDEKVAVDSLHAALSQLHDFEIFQSNGAKTSSLYELIDGVTVIKLSGYSADIQNLVVAITLDAFYSQMQKNGHSRIDGNYRQLTKMVLVDEADNFLSKNFLSLRKILKEGREFGVGTILSTQFLNHFSTAENEYDQYILTWIIHRVNDVKVKDIDALFSVQEKDKKEKLIQTIKKLQKHQSLVSLGGSAPVVIEDMPFWKLMET
ncbi:DNA phosphorothioation-dependent restriction protein DptH [Pedobacter terrae]|uniref:DNA phosphorothioation-dependent restriction protein DptH n=1 Tax=Pedobacter terrae TaxID=405671 RepID=A0A1G7Q4T6_9SPHI|nr:DUF87 domain-containing protein [Pedobacter terrae]SDF93503.1 DNA phosphorothioation-dependent restriction protein DptH [Pedobacter terrae]